MLRTPYDKTYKLNVWIIQSDLILLTVIGLTVLVVADSEMATGACAFPTGARELTATCPLTDRVLRNSSRLYAIFLSAVYLLDFVTLYISSALKM